jgi:hypothetical protein
MAAQIVHAAGESSPGDLPSGTYAIVLQHDDLVDLSADLRSQGIRHKAITENDGEFAGRITAIGCVPCPREHLRRYFSSFPLLR